MIFKVTLSNSAKFKVTTPQPINFNVNLVENQSFKVSVQPPRTFKVTASIGIPGRDGSSGAFRIITGNATASVDDHYIAYESDANATLDLPDISVTDSVILEIQNVGNGQLRLLPFGGQLIDGQADLSLYKNNQAIKIGSGGGKWRIW